MNLSRIVTRGLILPAFLAASLATPAFSAPGKTKTYNYTGNVANACSLSNGSIGLTVSRGGGSTITISFSPTANPTATCNAGPGGVLSLSSTRLVRQSNGLAQDYTVRLTGWNGNMDYTTAAVPPAATTASKSGAATTTLTLTCQTGCGTGQINNNATYTATISLGIAANP